MLASARIVCIASLCWLVCPPPGEAQHWSFQMYGTDQGLTNPTILGLHQDSQGFLWASTEGGFSATTVTAFGLSARTQPP